MPKAKAVPVYMSYPDPDHIRDGMKLSFYYYKDHDKAKKAQEAARHNANLKVLQGFDFGYTVPGCMHQMRANPNGLHGTLDGMWEVAIP